MCVCVCVCKIQNGLTRLCSDYKNKTFYSLTDRSALNGHIGKLKIIHFERVLTPVTPH